METKTRSLVDYAGLVLLGSIWGGSYIFIRVAGPEFGTLALIALRVSLGAAGLAAYAALTGFKFGLRGNLSRLFILSALNNIIPYLLITDAVQKLNASIGAILNATTPLFTALIGAVLAGEGLGFRKIAGVVLGLAGVTVLMGFSPLELSPTVLLAALECLLAAMAYGGAAVFTRYRIAHVDGLTASFAQLLAASLVIAPLSLAALPAAAPSPGAWAALGVLALLCTSFAYLIFFRLIRNLGATQGSTVTFLVPFFSLLWGVIFLGEPLTAGVAAGLVLILASVWLVMKAGR